MKILPTAGMSTSSHPLRGASPRRRIGWRRLAIGGLTAGVLLGSVSCASPPAGKAEDLTGISYAGAASPVRDLAFTDFEVRFPKWPDPPPGRVGVKSSGQELRQGARRYDIEEPYNLAPSVSPGQGHVPDNFPVRAPGRWVEHKDIEEIAIRWHPHLIDHVRRALESIRDSLVSRSAAELPPVRDGVLYSYQDGGGRVLYKIGGRNARWLSITKSLSDDTFFRFDVPHPRPSEPENYYADLSLLPQSLSGGGGLPPWIDVTPAKADRPAQASRADQPGNDAHHVRVTTPDGQTANVDQIGDHLQARGDDPILGLNGTMEGAALLRDFPRIDEAMHAAAQAKDGLLRGVRLGKDGEDGVALVGADGVTPVGADNPWAEQVQRAISLASLPERLFRIEDRRLAQVDRSKFTIRLGSERRTNIGELLDKVRGDVYLHEEFRSLLHLENGMIVPNSLPRDTKVIVREADRPGPEGTASQPDIRIHGGAEWRLMTGTGPGSGVVPISSGQIHFVCPDTNMKLPGCEQ